MWSGCLDASGADCRNYGQLEGIPETRIWTRLTGWSRRAPP